jgi:hypothetical protein
MLGGLRRWHNHSRFYCLKSLNAGEMELVEVALAEHKVLEPGVVEVELVVPLYRLYLPSSPSL